MARLGEGEVGVPILHMLNHSPTSTPTPGGSKVSKIPLPPPAPRPTLMMHLRGYIWSPCLS